jgi:hypothetical protein
MATTNQHEQADVLVTLSAFIVNAEYAARLTAQLLKRWEKTFKLDLSETLPAEFLTELSAVVRIATWQQAGVDASMREVLPPWRTLLRDLLRRLAYAPETFSNDPFNCSAPLARRVTELWFQKCSWSAPLILGVDMAAHRPDPQALLAAMAELLLRSRR